jgi:hypothetical protein
MRLTKPQVKLLRLALYLAIKWEEGVIDSYTGSKWSGNDKTFAKEIAQSRRLIKRFSNLKKKLVLTPRHPKVRNGAG